MRNLSTICAVTVLVLAFAAMPAHAKTYYVSQSSGNDGWSGDAGTSDGKTGPWKTLAKASIEYKPGDRIFLKCGDTWNEEFRPKGNGTPDNPIVISSYGEGKRPVIDREDFKQDLIGIHLVDQEGFKIVGIEFNRCQTGIYAEYAVGSPNRKYLWIENCYFHDSLLYQPYQTYPKRKIGLGICLFSHERKNKIVASDITVKNCEFRRLASGIWTNSPDNFNKSKGNIYNFGNFVVEDCLFEEGYQWQLGMRGVDGGAVRRCVTHDIGRNFRAFNGVAGAMFARCKHWVFEDSEWGYVSIGLGSGDGQAFDFESNCDHMKMRNCLFHDTDGAAMLLCCYASGPEAHKDLLFENCVLNGKCKRPIRPNNRCEIFNTTDWNDVKWKDCRFYVSKGNALMHVADPEKDKRSSFVNCVVRKLSDACTSPNLAAKAKVASSTKENEQWVQIDFGAPTAVNEFKLKEDPSSSISRYRIECWDDKASRWVGCFNGMDIGKEFVAPIVGRTTTKARMVVMRTAKGAPAITSFEAYNDVTEGRNLNASGK
ncbi:MAG: hypothetical protein EXR98_15470 [Gemmataceae bacterium]|nr:hypothetical protein [Gemmataceae bacterium]